MYKAIDIAKYTVTYCNKKEKAISNLKLQKIMYYLWIDYYKKLKKSLFDDEICAWQLGPVVPNVYYEFCSFAGIPILREYDIDNISCEDRDIINDIIEKYIDQSPSSLVSKTHESGKPWDKIYKGGEGLRNPIPFDLIKELECK